MKTITLYRVAHKTLRIGPWNCNYNAKFWTAITDEMRELINIAKGALNECFDTSAHTQKHPSAYLDFFGWDASMRCAVGSIEELRDWFDSSLVVDKLSDADFTVIAMTLPVESTLMGRSKTQYGYCPDDVLEEHDLSILALIA
jgi:hypothetical protein